MTRYLLPALAAAALIGAAGADTLSMPEGGEGAMGMPKRGLTMAAVEERFGTPVRVIPAVGDPPITRWVYQDYTVYFEHEYVIHPVKRTRQTGHSVQP